MNCYRAYLRLLPLFVVLLAYSAPLQGRPFVTVDIKSYDSLLADVGKIAAAAGQNASQMDAQLHGMVGPQVMALVDNSKPWHIAVWMDSPGQSPVIALILPVEDYEGFQAAVQTSMLAMMGASHLDAGDSVVLYGGKPGVVLPEGWDESIQKYATGFSSKVSGTVEAEVSLNAAFRAAAAGGLEMMRAGMMAAFEDPKVAAEAGMSPEAMSEFLNAYLSLYKNLILDTDSLHIGLGLRDAFIRSSVAIKPLPETGTAEFLDSQKVNIEDIALLADWSGDVGMIMGMGDLPDSWQPQLRSLMKAAMPLYGLAEGEADAWMDVIDTSLPLKGVFNMAIDDGMKFSGFYDILDAPAKELYEQWIKLTQEVGAGEEGLEGFYSEVQIQRGHREIEGVPVDLIALTMNSEHPSMKLPEQQAMMEEMFPGGKIRYEMALKGNRIYMAANDQLESVIATKPSGTAPVELNEYTRFAASVDFISMMKLGAGAANKPGMPDFSKLDSDGTAITYAFDVSDRLVMRNTFPLKLIQVFSEMSKPMGAKPGDSPLED